ncbi:hypothetical protein BDP27DRAFT_1427425 [Rhodocollybia butyracea]|uniref:Uncharacterized protein n=1 Tax=Rhodocollybia butyracea TaxID=206335 RepID=A0A9P5PGT2_9AGAR|nr:hypothetical protein BDP27DRAFT_1427425 [Rhodocollybia butyracea]
MEILLSPCDNNSSFLSYTFTVFIVAHNQQQSTLDLFHYLASVLLTLENLCCCAQRCQDLPSEETKTNGKCKAAAPPEGSDIEELSADESCSKEEEEPEEQPKKKSTKVKTSKDHQNSSKSKAKGKKVKVTLAGAAPVWVEVQDKPPAPETVQGKPECGTLEWHICTSGISQKLGLGGKRSGTCT